MFSFKGSASLERHLRLDRELMDVADDFRRAAFVDLLQLVGEVVAADAMAK